MADADDRILLIRHRYGSRSEIKRIDAVHATQIQEDVEVLVEEVDRLTREREIAQHELSQERERLTLFIHQLTVQEERTASWHRACDEFEAACAALRREREQLQQERNTARYLARVLASAWQNYFRPPTDVVRQALAFAVDQRGEVSPPERREPT